MSRQYGDHFNSNSTPGVATLTGTLPLDDQRRAAVGLAHGRRRTKVMRAAVGTAGMTSADELRMGTFKSGDRIYSLILSSAGTSTTYACDIGLYLSGTNHTGAVVDADLFDAAALVSTAIDEVDHFATGALANVDKGKTLWELAAIGAGSDTVDPMVDYDLVLTSTATGTTVIETLVIWVEFSSSD